MSRHTANATKMSSRATVAYENVSRAGEDSHRRMNAMLDDLMGRISNWMKQQDETNASFESDTSVIRGLGEDKAKLCSENNLLRAKIVGREKEHEETTALLKRTCFILKKLMDENAMLRIEREGWWRNPWMLPSSMLRT